MYGEYSGCCECKFFEQDELFDKTGKCSRIGGTSVRANNWCALFEPANQPLRTDSEPE